MTRLAFFGAVVTLSLGLLGFFAPWFMVEVVGFTFLPGQGRGLSEMRATYGMFFIAMGAVLIWALIFRARGAPYLRFAGILWLAAGFGRLLSMLVDGAWLPFNFLALALELVVGLPLLIASFQQVRTEVDLSPASDISKDTHALADA